MVLLYGFTYLTVAKKFKSLYRWKFKFLHKAHLLSALKHSIKHKNFYMTCATTYTEVCLGDAKVQQKSQTSIKLSEIFLVWQVPHCIYVP